MGGGEPVIKPRNWFADVSLLSTTAEVVGEAKEIQARWDTSV